MNRLISESIRVGDISELSMFPQELLLSEEKKIVEFITEYFVNIGQLPTIERIKKDFPFFVPITSVNPEPLRDIYNQTIRRKTVARFQTILNDAQTEVMSGSIPEAQLQEMQAILNYGAGIDEYSKFPETAYFTNKVLGFGLKLIDSAIGGIHPGEFFTLAGRLGTGKTWVLLWLVLQWLNEAKKILLVSNEMLQADIFSRLDGMVAGFNPLELRNIHEAPKETREKVAKARGIAKTLPGKLYIPKTRLLSPESVYSLAKSLAVDVVVIDGFYLMKPAGQYVQKWERVGAISNSLKQLALETGIPCVAVTQVKRAAADNEEYNPEDLAYSDATGQDSDFVVSLWRSMSEPNQLRVDLVKNRFGPISSTLVQIDWNNSRLVELSIQNSPPIDVTNWLQGDKPKEVEAPKLPEPIVENVEPPKTDTKDEVEEDGWSFLDD